MAAEKKELEINLNEHSKNITSLKLEKEKLREENIVMKKSQSGASDFSGIQFGAPNED
jgi:hypothetical protein